MTYHQNHQQQLNGNSINLICVKISIIFLLTGISLLSFSQQEIKFGYHDASGNVKNIDELENDNIDDSIIFITDTIISNNIIDSSLLIKNKSNLDSKSGTIIISVLLPFHIDKNDKLQIQLAGTSRSEIFNSSKLPLRLLEGILIAVDSLAALGISVELNVFDTKNDKNVISEILHQNKLDSSHIVFGPLWPDNYKLVRNWYKYHSEKILINPKSSRISLLKNSPNVFFLTPTEIIRIDSIISFLDRNKKDVLIVTYKDQENDKNIPILKNKLSKDSISFSVYNFPNLNHINQKTCHSLLDDEDKCLVVMNHDESFINRFISFCGTTDKETLIIGSESWNEFSDLNIETLMKLNVHIPISNFIDSDLLINRDLFNAFEQRFYHKIDKNAYLSFKSILHFTLDNLQFNFSDDGKGGGKVNTDVRMCVYKDYHLIPIN